MNAPATWYNAERVAVKGSVILQSWMAERQSARIEASTLERGNRPITQEELLSALGGASSWAGPAVNERTAMCVGAVYACVGLIAGAIACMPLPIYQRTPDGRQKADHDYWWLFNEEPHANWDAATFWEYVVASKLLHGDGFAELIRPSVLSSRVDALEPHHPDRVNPVLLRNKTLAYEITDSEGKQRVVGAADMLHFKGLGFDGRRSLSPIRHAAKQAVGISMAATEHSAKFFANGARPDFALTTSGKLDPEQVKTLRNTWAARHAGSSNAHMPAVLTGGLDVKPLTMNAEDTQLLGTLGFTVEEIARVYGVPPHMIAKVDKSTSWGSGVEQMGIGFIKYTLQRHLVKFEQEINRKLWPVREKYFVEFLTAGLERGDYKTRNEGYRIAAGRAGEPGWMTINEIRKLENLPPIAGGDELNKGSNDAKTPAAA